MDVPAPAFPFVKAIPGVKEVVWWIHWLMHAVGKYYVARLTEYGRQVHIHSDARCAGSTSTNSSLLTAINLARGACCNGPVLAVAPSSPFPLYACCCCCGYASGMVGSAADVLVVGGALYTSMNLSLSCCMCWSPCCSSLACHGPAPTMPCNQTSVHFSEWLPWPVNATNQCVWL